MWEKFKLMWSGVWEFLRPFVTQMMTEAGQILAATAMQAVKIVAETMPAADGSEKRAAAFEKIAADLASLGVNLAASTINAAIEAAVVKLKEGAGE